jgi:hypothetical protein
MRVLPIFALAAVIATTTVAGPAVASVTAGDPAEMVLVRGGGGGFHGGGFCGGGFHHGYGYGYRLLPTYGYACPYPTYGYPYCTYPYAY